MRIGLSRSAARHRNQAQAGVGALSLGLGVAGVVAAFHGASATVIKVLAFVVVAAGLLLIATAWAQRASAKIDGFVIDLSARLRGRFDEFDTRWATADDDLSATFDLASRVLPFHGYPTRAAIDGRIAVNPKIVLTVIHVGRSQPDICGFFMIYPLTVRSTRAIVAGSITRGYELAATETQRSWRRPGAVYIGAIGALGAMAKAATLLALRQFLRDYSDVDVFARPATTDGLRLLRHNGFVPVIDEDGIWRRTATPLP